MTKEFIGRGLFPARSPDLPSLDLLYFIFFKSFENNPQIFSELITSITNITARMFLTT